MRVEFSQALEKNAKQNEKVIVLTADLGFRALENVKSAIAKRFVNVGVCEQNMISLAAGISSEGFKVVCYSIAPFSVFRPTEQIRLDVCLHNKDVKIVGNGGGYGYGIMGATHHAIEDIAVMSSFQNMKCYIPFCNEDVEEVFNHMMKRCGPSYLRLGLGLKPKELILPKYEGIRKLLGGDSVTVISLGPVTLNVFKALENYEVKNSVDLFVVSEMPIESIKKELKESIQKTKKIVVVEEHVKRGGLGENISSLLLEEGICCKFIHVYAKGYPNGLYGSQSYHQKISGLDPESITKIIRKLMNERK